MVVGLLGEVEAKALLDAEDDVESKRHLTNWLEACDELNGSGLRWARKGLPGAGWVKLLVGMGVESGTAHGTVKKLGKLTLKGGGDIWRAFNMEVHGRHEEQHANGCTLSEVEEVILELEECLFEVGHCRMGIPPA